ncbi:caspase family protein [Bradyrhizobium liaoningense]|uniref:caspase family protein n=1 Tax=Bradyrhizobium liaoningense TaxID=43992 RepID=UPI001FE9BA35|nr:caspase family protein [Bradyrhizobium liaoningense]
MAETRVALVVGNGAYTSTAQLPNPSHDAEDVAASLKRSGFEVLQGIDLRQAEMQDLTIRFARAASRADVAMFYDSGHAMQYNGVNYLMPIDAMLSDEADLKRFVRVDDIVNDLQQAKNLRILVLDSCATIRSPKHSSARPARPAPPRSDAACRRSTRRAARSYRSRRNQDRSPPTAPAATAPTRRRS